MRQFLCATLAFFCLALSASADIADPTKWSQLPNMGPWGYDFSSGTLAGSMVADDFLCSSDLPVVDVHWWGSYYTPGVLWPYPNSDNLPDPTVTATGAPQPPGILLGFNIEFYSDVPAGQDPYMPWSHPGQCLEEYCIDIANVTEVLYGTVTHIGNILENVWQYNCDLPRPFFQDPEAAPQDLDGDGLPDGTVYWLKIQAVLASETIQWGWHEADALWHDNAVQHWPPNPSAPYWDMLSDKDMAFELSIIPEPSLFPLLGFAGLVLLRRLRTR
jgi:hypothetical protein